MQHLNRKKKKINQDLLDLFVGMDMEEVKVMDGNGQLKGYNMQLLTNEAVVFLSHLKALGVDDLPEPQELIQEWFAY